jgi:hypothetical protein
MLIFYHYCAILAIILDAVLATNRSSIERRDVLPNSPAGSLSSVHHFPASGAPIFL